MLKEIRIGAMLLPLLAAGCTSTQAPKLEGVGSSTPMQTGELAGRSALVWRASNLDPKQYTSFIIEPVEIYRGADADFAGASEAELQQLAAYMQQEFTRALRDRYAVTSVPSPATARVKLVLAGIENNVPGVASVTRMLPAGLAMNMANSAMGQPGSFTGSVTIAGQVFDSVTNAPMLTFIQKRYPNALDIVATVSSREAHQAAITQAADAFRKRLDEVHTAAR
jgi:hypothetical protein